MSELAKRYVIAYDIVDDRRRDRVAKCLQAHGVRMQFSVFFVDTRPARMLRLVSRLTNLIEEDKDSIMVCDLGFVSSLGTTTVTYLGNSRKEPPRTSVIV